MRATTCAGSPPSMSSVVYSRQPWWGAAPRGGPARARAPHPRGRGRYIDGMATVAEREIESNGLSFETLLAGPEDGEVVMLLHGYPQSAASWQETMEWLAERGMRAIAPNLRGYSPNANPVAASAYSMDQLIDDVIGIADAEGVDRFHLVGHDIGGGRHAPLPAAQPDGDLDAPRRRAARGHAHLDAIGSQRLHALLPDPAPA